MRKARPQDPAIQRTTRATGLERGLEPLDVAAVTSLTAQLA